MAGILDFKLPDYSMVGQGVQRADLPPMPDAGFAGQALQDDIMARKNFRNQQIPAPLMTEPAPVQEPFLQSPLEQQSVAVEPTTQQPVIVEPVKAVAPPKENKEEQKQVQQAYTEGKKQAAMTIGADDEFKAQQKRLADIAAQKQKAWDEGQQKLKEVDAETAKLEPKDYWADKSTGSKIAAAIAMGLGAYASAMTGTQNAPMQIINDAISRDLNLQKEKYQRAKDRGATIKSQYSDLVARLGDQEAAELTLMNAAYKNIEMKLAAQAAATTNQVQQMNIQKLRQEIDLSKQQADAKRAEKMMMQKLATGQAGDVNPELLPEDARKRYISDKNFGGLARSEEGAKKVSESLIEYRNAKDLLGTLQEIQKIGGKSLSPELRARAETAAAALKGKLRGTIVGPGAVSESEWKLLNDIVKNPTDFFTLDSRTQERLNSISNLLDTNMKNTAQAYGVSSKVPLSEANQVMVKVDGKTGYIPKQNLDAFKKAMEVQKRKFEVLGG